MEDRLSLRQDHLHAREIDGEVVVLDARASLYMAANRAGSLLWAMLEGQGATRADLVRRLTDEYGIDERAATADVDSFVTSLREHGLLVR